MEQSRILFCLNGLKGYFTEPCKTFLINIILSYFTLGQSLLIFYAFNSVRQVSEQVSVTQLPVLCLEASEPKDVPLLI